MNARTTATGLLLVLLVVACGQKPGVPLSGVPTDVQAQAPAASTDRTLEHAPTDPIALDSTTSTAPPVAGTGDPGSGGQGQDDQTGAAGTSGESHPAGATGSDGSTQKSGPDSADGDGTTLAGPTGDDRTGAGPDRIVLGWHAPVTGVAPLPSRSFEDGRNLYFDFIKFAGRANAQGYRPQYAGVGVSMGLNVVASSACSASAGAVDGAMFFSPFPGLDWARDNEPVYFEQAAREDYAPDDIAFALWGLNKTLHALLLRYEQTYGQDLTREDFRSVVEQQTDVRSGIFPPVSYSPQDHFVASTVHVLTRRLPDRPVRHRGHVRIRLLDAESVAKCHVPCPHGTPNRSV